MLKLAIIFTSFLSLFAEASVYVAAREIMVDDYEVEDEERKWDSPYFHSVKVKYFNIVYGLNLRTKAQSPIVLAYDASSGWDEKRVIKELEESARILSQCGLVFEEVKLVSFKLSAEAKEMTRPLDRTGIDPRYYDAKLPESKLVGSVRVRERPLVFFNQAYTTSAINNHSLKSYGAGKLKEALNTVWVDFKNYTVREKGQVILDSFSVTAHELAHVFGDMGHIQTGSANLMNARDGAPKGGILSQAQCEKIQQFKGY